MQEVDIAQVTRRSIKGVFALTSRTFFVQVVGLISNLLLTIFLSPSVFGVFFVVSSAIAFLSYFSDIGLAAALIQKKESPTREELRTTFTIQQILVIFICAAALLLSGAIASFYRLEENGLLLFRALIVAFFLSSFKTIPSIILERELRFEKLVIPQIVETLVFNISAVALAMAGFGILSFTVAVLLRGISGVITIYIISPWRVGFAFSKPAARKLLSFGIPFQANSFLALLKDDLLIVYIGKVLPLAQVGYIGFAQKWALMPLRLVMDNVIRITFPSFSRLQHERETLAKGLEKSIFASCFIIFPSLVGLVVMSPYFIQLIPKYIKWEPALFSLWFFSANAALSSISTPLTNALNSIGKIKITLYLMIFWTVGTWVITPLAINAYGFNGVSVSSAIVATSVVGVVYLVKRHINFSILKIVGYPALSSGPKPNNRRFQNGQSKLAKINDQAFCCYFCL
ncbi:MAG: oligosaccharide flippase family protein [Candidatus Levybacteria bacterium]|nr:oligosaccharide flippase family protein [Candidatus Levybacteria bacterium]